MFGLGGDVTRQIKGIKNRKTNTRAYIPSFIWQTLMSNNYLSEMRN